MRLWRTARDEVAGAWRSLRYDLQRRSRADRPGATRGQPNTDPHSADVYGINDLWGDAPDFDDEYDQPRRRLVAVAAFALLAAVGAAGSYLAVANGLGLLLSNAAETYPLADARPAPTAVERPSPVPRQGVAPAISPPPVAQPTARRRAAAPATTRPKPGPSSTATVVPRIVAPTGWPCRCTPRP
ncbi:MAG TPA: hypothetical protein VFO77_04100, partial [Actinoplanes sp.]|nr:hypothetical protein [Actinoplanes sp.]